MNLGSWSAESVVAISEVFLYKLKSWRYPIVRSSPRVSVGRSEDVGFPAVEADVIFVSLC